ncbi:hypothetical protein [Rhodoplanes roseus]|uniref:Uncharacterized protein n=1 Tax=Rhodoplanes roseus TaxID=29409 RepID=A0A327L3W1_9BRAD|nr:hypothetical protein [Rhodoplanes roseus]RAI45251.1 hypothetical protein CH341_04880 [Rhodoplanes roseus]
MAAPFSADRLFSRTMVDAGHLARQSERMMQRLAQAAERFGYDHGLRLQGQVRTLGRVGDRVCAYAFGPGILPLEACDYTLLAARRVLRNVEPVAGAATPFAPPGGVSLRPPADNGFLLAERMWSDLVNQVLDLQHDVFGVWLDLGREAVQILPGFGPGAEPNREDRRG